jgi:peptide/nickel transport system permease protein
MAPLIVAASSGCAGAILTEAALSFVGLGATPPQPSWGSMLQSAYPYLTLAPWLSIFPGIAISVATLGFIFLGDGLRDIFDPRLRGR